MPKRFTIELDDDLADRLAKRMETVPHGPEAELISMVGQILRPIGLGEGNRKFRLAYRIEVSRTPGSVEDGRVLVSLAALEGIALFTLLENEQALSLARRIAELAADKTSQHH